MLAALPTLVVLLATAPGEPTPASTPLPPPSATPPPVSGSANGCPSAVELAETLNARVPGLVSAAPAAPLQLASGMRLAVVTSPDGDVRVDLVDAKDEVVLHRLLPAPPRGHVPDCPALAETVAIIVERYLHDVGYEAPPLPPPAPTTAPAPAPPAPATVVVATPPPPASPAARAVLWRLGLMASGRRGDAGGLDGDADLTLGLEGTHVGARLSAGLAPRAAAQWSNDRATLERLPLRLGVFVCLPAGPGRLEPGVGVGADILFVSATGPGTASGSHLAPSADVSLGYAMTLIGPVYGRVLSRAALVAPYTFKTLAGVQVWGTPRAYGEVGVELGVSFP